MKTLEFLVGQFGPWAIVVIMAGVFIQFYKNQIETSRADRIAESERHREEVAQLTEVIQNNTLALQRLIDKMGGKEHE